MTPEEIRAMIAQLQAQLPADETPAEPPDIRKTNAGDDPCPMCGTVHTKSAYEPIHCRCIYCNQIGPVAMTTYDPVLGQGVVCSTCWRRGAPPEMAQGGGGFVGGDKLPWEL